MGTNVIGLLDLLEFLKHQEAANGTVDKVKESIILVIARHGRRSCFDRVVSDYKKLDLNDRNFLKLLLTKVVRNYEF